MGELLRSLSRVVEKAAKLSFSVAGPVLANLTAQALEQASGNCGDSLNGLNLSGSAKMILCYGGRLGCKAAAIVHDAGEGRIPLQSMTEFNIELLHQLLEGFAALIRLGGVSLDFEDFWKGMDLFLRTEPAGAVMDFTQYATRFASAPNPEPPARNTQRVFFRKPVWW